MLTKKLLAPIEIVFHKDPALCNIPDSMMNRYLESRNIKDLDESLFVGKPTIFLCSPLLSKWEYLIEDKPTMGELWTVFKLHVREIKNFDFEGFDIFDKEKALKEEIREKFLDWDMISEIALVIIQAPVRFNKYPFTQPGSWLLERMKTRAFLARNATEQDV